MFMDMPLKGFSQNRKKRDIDLNLLGSERSLVLGNGTTLAAWLLLGRKAILFNA